MCASCTLVAGDVIDGAGMLDWLASYREGLDESPPIWGLHDYYDTTYFRTTGLADYARAVSGQVWLTETGGIVELRTRDGQVSLGRDELRARASVSFAFETARAFAGRVSGLYLYQWKAAPNDRFDAGLLRPDGSARPAFDVLRTQAAALAGTASGTAASAPAPPRTIPARVTVRASGAADVRVRCRGAARCTGRLWIEGASFADGTLVNGRVPGYVLQPVGVRYRLTSGQRTKLSFRVPRAVLAHALPQRLLRLRLMVSSADEPFALRGRYRVDAWRLPAQRRSTTSSNGRRFARSTHSSGVRRAGSEGRAG